MTHIECARSWLGTRFEHQGRSRHGVDCAGLVICVLREMGYVAPDFDVNGYERQPDGSMFRICDEMLPRAPVEAGSIFVMRFAQEPQHMGFVAPYRWGGLSIIHALQSRKKVVEHRLDDIWRARIVGTFGVPQ